jgi:hypothetical protein
MDPCEQGGLIGMRIHRRQLIEIEHTFDHRRRVRQVQDGSKLLGDTP